jgi:hypothetical protein
MNITTVYEPATYRTAHHGGSGEQYPAIARVVDRKTGATVEITNAEYPGLDRHALIEKAVAILRNRFHVR